MGFKNIKKAGLKSRKGNHLRLKKSNGQKKNRFLLEAAPSVATNSLLRLVGLKPAAPSGRNRQAERRESQGVLARLCEFPG